MPLLPFMPLLPTLAAAYRHCEGGTTEAIPGQSPIKAGVKAYFIKVSLANDVIYFLDSLKPKLPLFLLFINRPFYSFFYFNNKKYHTRDTRND